MTLIDPFNSGLIVESNDTQRIREIVHLCSERINSHFRAIDDWQGTRSLFEAELPKAEFPPPLKRTPFQEKVARCPRCRGELYEPPRTP